MTIGPTYDSDLILSRLSRLGRESKTAFAAACAQSLLPAFQRYSATVGDVKNAEVLTEAIDMVWATVGSRLDRMHMIQVKEVVEEMVPSDGEPDWVWETGLAQNSVAAVAYAIGTCLTDDQREAEWASRQVYDFADYVAVDELVGDAHFFPPAAVILATRTVRGAFEAIEEWLQIAETGAGWEDLREKSRAVGAWLDLEVLGRNSNS